MRLLVVFFLFLALCVQPALSGQEMSSWKTKPELALSGYMEVFYLYDFNAPPGPGRQPFLFNHNRHNAFSLNLGLLKVRLDHSKYRSNIGLHAGTYVQDNYAAEPDALRFISEANLGISLNKSNTCWLDAGIFPSHIGFESVIAMDNATMTRSLLAENSPYFLAGAKVTYTTGDSWVLMGWIGNGWQRIQQLEGSTLPSFGTQMTYTPSKRISFNWSTFAGTDDPDTSRRWRFFNNFYSAFSLNPSTSVTIGLDVGLQQRSRQSGEYDSWMSPVIIARYAFSDEWKTAMRIEYYQDKTGIIIPVLNPAGFQALGWSWNLDFTPVPNIMWRSEIRWLGSRADVFEAKNGLLPATLFLGTSLAIRFDRAM